MTETTELNTDIELVPFYKALESLIKYNTVITRSGWNGKGMYVYKVPYEFSEPKLSAEDSLVNEEGKVVHLPYLMMKTVTGDVVPWLASQTDLLANDWILLGVPMTVDKVPYFVEPSLDLIGN